MKALLLAGGKGTRLYPTTEFYNKHLIHVYDRPMIIHSIDTIKKSGITDVILSLSKDKPELFIEYLKDGSELGVNLTYIIQNDARGIAYAINQAKHLLINEDKFMVYLADNYFNKDLSKYVKKFSSINMDSMILLKETKTPERYGVAVINYDNMLLQAFEKPKKYISNKNILGAYFFSNKFFDVFENLRPSQRNEYEITDILNNLVPNVLSVSYNNEWYDLGTFDDISKCSESLRKKYTCKNSIYYKKK